MAIVGFLKQPKLRAFLQQTRNTSLVQPCNIRQNCGGLLGRCEAPLPILDKPQVNGDEQPFA